MWVVAGILLGVAVLSAVLGFHAGPHAHVASAVFGIVAAAWLIAMAATGQSGPVLYVLLGADLSMSALLGYGGWKAVTSQGRPVGAGSGVESLVGRMGTAVGDLTPSGVVRVAGEEWSAVSLNGPAPAGTPVQVIEADGVRLGVWGETGRAAPDEAGRPEPLGQGQPDHGERDEGAST